MSKRVEAGSSFGKAVVELGSSLGKALEKVGPETVFKTLTYGLPVVAAMELINLEPTGDVVGEYIKNKLVPGMEESNKAREMELEARMEMGTRHLPAINAQTLSQQAGRQQKQQEVQEAMENKAGLLADIKEDPYLSEVEESQLDKLVTDAITLAPITTVENPSVLLSLIRSAALTGADTIDIQTAQQLTLLEQSYLGRRS